jgi:hypothetical protein
MSHRARITFAHLSFPLTAAVFTFALLATAGTALAAVHDPQGPGSSYYNRYALPWVRKYAPPNTAPGTYGDQDQNKDDDRPQGSSDQH